MDFVFDYGIAGAVLELGERLHFDREQLRHALLAGSAQGFALKAVPGLLRPRGAGATSNTESLHDMLKKDIDHASKLAPADDPALAPLIAAAETMLDRLRQNEAGRAR